MKRFEEVTRTPYQYFVVDLKPMTTASERLVSHIFKENDDPSREFIRDRSSVLKENAGHRDTDTIIGMPSCDDCGIVFASTHALQNHVKHGCNKRPIGEQTDAPPLERWDSSESESEERHRSQENLVFADLFRKATTKNEEMWQRKIAKYEQEGLSLNEAEKKAEEKTKKEDVKHVLRMYRKYLTYAFQLENGTIHQRVMSDIREFMEDGMGLPQAIQSAVRKQKCLIESLVKPESEEDSEEEDEHFL